MSLSSLLSRPVTIIHRSPSGSTDLYGNDVPAESSVATVGELQQTQRVEPGTEGELSVTTWLLILPPGTVFTTADAAVIDGQEYEAVGEPWAARNPRTGLDSHLEATVRRTAGEGPCS